MEHNNNNVVLVIVLIACSLRSLSVEAVKDLPAAPEPKPKNEMLSTKFIEEIKASKLAPRPLAKEICGRTQNSVLCEQTVTATNNNSQPINPKNVVLLLVTATMGETILAYKDCIDAAKMDENKDLAKSYKFCEGSYKKAGDELGHAIKALTGNDMKTTMTLIQGAMKHVQDCQKEIEASECPLKQVNEFLTKVADDSIAVATAINTGGLRRRKY